MKDELVGVDEISGLSWRRPAELGGRIFVLLAEVQLFPLL